MSTDRYPSAGHATRTMKKRLVAQDAHIAALEAGYESRGLVLVKKETRIARLEAALRNVIHADSHYDAAVLAKAALAETEAPDA